MFPDTTLADAANYCRALGGETLPWCYTTSTEQRWDYCDFETIYWGILCDADRSKRNLISDLMRYKISSKQMNRHIYDIFGVILSIARNRI